MRKILLIPGSLFIQLSVNIFAQGVPNNPMNKISSFTISLSSFKNANENFPYSNIEFVDARADNFTAGFYTKENGAPKKYVFRKGLITEFKNYFQNNYQCSNSYNDSTQLLIAIKKFWISDYLVDTLIFGQKTDKRCIVISAEIFKHISEYYVAFFRVDTVLRLESDFTTFNGEDVCIQALNWLLEKCISSTIDITKKKHFAKEEIMHHLNSSYSFPILQDTTFKKGIYYTFSDFKNNKSSGENFEPCGSESAGNIYIVNGNGEKQLVENFWGISDGNIVYVHFKRNLIPVIKSSNALFISGIDLKKSNALGKLGFALLGNYLGYDAIQTATFLSSIRTNTNSKDNLPNYPLQLDWDTGKFY